MAQSKCQHGMQEILFTVISPISFPGKAANFAKKKLVNTQDLLIELPSALAS